MVASGANHVIRGLKLSVPPPSLGKGEGLEIEFNHQWSMFNQSSLCNEASITHMIVLKIELPYDPAIPLLGIYLEKVIIRKDTCTPVFTAALFTIAKTWK